MNAYLIDLAERVVMTFLATFLTAFSVTDMGTLEGAALAGCAASLTLVKGAVAQFIGDDSPGFK